jgi:hypothetical protein
VTRTWTIKPCQRCGGPKGTGEKRRLCDPCRVISHEDRERSKAGKAALPDYRRERNLKLVFNMTVDEYDAILEYQGGICAICDHPPKTRRLSVDHDHKTGLIRGLLCHQCNRALGGMGSDADDRIHRMSYYLNHNAPLEALGHYIYGRKGPVKPKRRKR